MKFPLPVMLICLVAGLRSTPVSALDPPTVKGHLQFGQQRYELRHAQSVRNPYDSSRVWILLTTAEIPAKDAADPGRTLSLAMEGKLSGVRLNVDAAAPKADELQGALLLSKQESPSGEIVVGAGGQKYWERLVLGDKRIVGTLHFAKEASSFSDTPAWAIDLDFSVPVPSAR